MHSAIDFSAEACHLFVRHVNLCQLRVCRRLQERAHCLTHFYTPALYSCLPLCVQCGIPEATGGCKAVYWLRTTPYSVLTAYGDLIPTEHVQTCTSDLLRSLSETRFGSQIRSRAQLALTKLQNHDFKETTTNGRMGWYPRLEKLAADDNIM